MLCHSQPSSKSLHVQYAYSVQVNAFLMNFKARHRSRFAVSCGSPRAANYDDDLLASSFCVAHDNATMYSEYRQRGLHAGQIKSFVLNYSKAFRIRERPSGRRQQLEHIRDMPGRDEKTRMVSCARRELFTQVIRIHCIPWHSFCEFHGPRMRSRT